MNRLLKVILSAIGGVAMGIAVLFLALVATVAFAFATGGQVNLPGVLNAWFTTENDAPALNFEPNGIGMAAVVIVVAAICVVATWRSTRRPQQRSAGL